MIIKVNGKEYTFEEAEKLGFLQPIKKETSIIEDQPQAEISIDYETRSISISVDGKESVDVPKKVMIEVTGYGSYKGWLEHIEEEGLEDDEEFAMLIAKEMGLIV